MARILGQDPVFTQLAQSFEQQAISYYNSKGTLEGITPMEKDVDNTYVKHEQGNAPTPEVKKK